MWAVATRRNVQRASAYGGGRTVAVYEPDERYGLHETNVGAKRAFLASWMAGEYRPEWPDDFVAHHFNAQRANIGMAKVVRIPTSRQEVGSGIPRRHLT